MWAHDTTERRGTPRRTIPGHLLTAWSEVTTLPSTSTVDQPDAEAALGRALWIICAIWIGVQAHRQLVPVLLGASPVLRDFGITADAAGLLAAVYFPVYGLLQIPSGLLADRSGFTRLLTVCSLLLGFGGLAFALSPTLGWAIGARVVVAIASSLFWVPALQFCLNLAPSLYARSVGIISAVGGLGAVVSLVVLPLLLERLPWQAVALLTSLPLFPLALLVVSLLRPPAQPQPAARPRRDLPLLASALRDVRLWGVAWPAMMWSGTWFGVLTWLPRYSRDVLETGPAATGLLAAVANAALIPGSYLFGWLMSRFPGRGRHLFYLAQFASLGAALWLPLLGGQPDPAPLIAISCFLGFSYGAFFQYASLLAGVTPEHRLGATTGLANALTTLPAFLAPWLMGLALDLVDRPTASDPAYSAAAYDVAWYIAAAFIVLGLAGGGLLARWEAGRKE